MPLIVKRYHCTPRSAAAPRHKEEPCPRACQLSLLRATVPNPNPQPASCLCPSLPQRNLPVHVSASPAHLTLSLTPPGWWPGMEPKPGHSPPAQTMPWEWGSGVHSYPRTEALSWANKKSTCIASLPPRWAFLEGIPQAASLGLVIQLTNMGTPEKLPRDPQGWGTGYLPQGSTFSLWAALFFFLNQGQ